MQCNNFQSNGISRGMQSQVVFSFVRLLIPHRPWPRPIVVLTSRNLGVKCGLCETHSKTQLLPLQPKWGNSGKSCNWHKIKWKSASVLAKFSCFPFHLWHFLSFSLRQELGRWVGFQGFSSLCCVKLILQRKGIPRTYHRKHLHDVRPWTSSCNTQTLHRTSLCNLSIKDRKSVANPSSSRGSTGQKMHYHRSWYMVCPQVIFVYPEVCELSLLKTIFWHAFIDNLTEWRLLFSSCWLRPSSPTSLMLFSKKKKRHFPPTKLSGQQKMSLLGRALSPIQINRFLQVYEQSHYH